MKAADNINEFVRNAAVKTNPEMDEAVFSKVLAAHKRMKNKKSALTPPILRRTVMKNPITKLAAAVVIVAAAAVSLMVVDKVTSPAYAIEQTAEALKNVRFMHIVRRDKAGNVEDERWVEIDSNGIQARYRQDTPQRDFFVVDDRQTVMVHHPDKDTVILYDANEKCWTWIYAPGKLFQELAHRGPDYCTVDENVQYKGRPAHHLRWVVADVDIYIDPKTRLPIA
ncbi:MAG: hypothetical protein JSW59_10095, partial [Phycisphaerales bacterium]